MVRRMKAETETLYDVGLKEPGTERFLRVRKTKGASDNSLRQYAQDIGTVRKIAGRPLLGLSVEDVEMLAEKLSERPKVLSVVLGMFYRSHRKLEHAETLRGIKDHAKRLNPNDVLTISDVDALIAHAKNLRDRGLIALLAATGCRISEAMGLRMKDLRAANGDAIQCYFGKVKVRGRERFSPKIAGRFKEHLETWLRAHPGKDNPEAFVFPSFNHMDNPIGASEVRKLMRTLAKKAGISKPCHPHSLRHARFTWGIVQGEDMAKLSIGIWGTPMSLQANRYSHFAGAEMNLGALTTPVSLDLAPMPEPPIFETRSSIIEAAKEQAIAEFLRAVRDDPEVRAQVRKAVMLSEEMDELQEERRKIVGGK